MKHRIDTLHFAGAIKDIYARKVYPSDTVRENDLKLNVEIKGIRELAYGLRFRPTKFDLA